MRRQRELRSSRFPANGEMHASESRSCCVTGDNRLKQGVAPEKVRATYEEALELAREDGLEERDPAARRDQAGRSRAARRRIASTRSACSLTSCAAAAARAASFGHGSAAARRKPVLDLVLARRVDEDAGLRRDELRRSADARSRRPTGRPPSPRAAPGRTARRGSARRRRGRHAIRPGISSWRDAARDRDPGPALELGAKRAVADERQRPLAQPLERAGEPERVLPLGQRADARGRPAGPAGAGWSGKRSRSTPQSTTSTLPRGRRHLRLQLAAQPVGDGDRREAARRTTIRVAAATPGSVPMFATSWPCAVTTSGARDEIAAARPAGTRKCA